MRKQSIIVHHGEVHAVDQDKDAHQQAQPLPEPVAGLAGFQNHLFAM